MNTLKSTAKTSESLGHFMRSIQLNETLLKEVYDFERSTPENIQKYKFAGWFTIAADFYNEVTCKP